MPEADAAMNPRRPAGLPEVLELDGAGAHYLDDGLVAACREWSLGVGRVLTPVYADVSCGPCRRALLERCGHCLCDIGGAVLLVEAGLMPLHSPGEHVKNAYDREWIMVRGWDEGHDDVLADIGFEAFAASHPELVLWTLG